MPTGLLAQTAEDHYNSGYQAYQTGDWAKAGAELTSATQINPSYWEAYQLLSYASFKNHEVKQAIQYGETSLALYPHNSTLKNFVNRLKSSTMPEPPDTEEPAKTTEEKWNPNVAPTIPGRKSDEKINSTYLDLGLSRPFAPSGFSDDWGSGPAFGAGYGLGISRAFSLVMDMHYSSFPWSYAVPGVTTTGGGIHLVTLLVNAKFNFTDRDNPVIFYGIVGTGPTILTFDDLTATGPGGTASVPGFSETDLGLRLGLGIDIQMAKGLYLTVESNGVDTFTSQKVATEGYMTNSLLQLGLRIDNQ